MDAITTVAVETAIVEVTVLTDRAMVTRQGKVTLPPGVANLVVAGLPAAIDTDSVRLSGQASGAVTIGNIHTDRTFEAEPITGIEEQIRDVQQRITGVQDRLAATQR